MISDMILQVDGCFLRNLKIEDCNDNYLGWLNDTQVNEYLETRFIEQSLDKIKEFVLSINNSSDSYLFGIFNDQNTHLGNIKIGPIHPRYKFADISYFIGEKMWRGNGYASKAIQLITEFGFNQLDLLRIQAGVHSSNIASRKVLEKCGYKQEACLRKKIYHGMDQNILWDDHLYFGIIKEEF